MLSERIEWKWVEAFAQVNIERHTDADATAFREAVRSLDEVVACYVMTGEMDFLLRILVPDLDAYGDFIRRKLLKMPSVKDVRTSFAIEVIKNGQVVLSVAVEGKSKSGRLGVIGFQESGWFLVRSVTDHSKTFRFASTAPFYVEVGEGNRRISRTAVESFLDWSKERIARVRQSLADPKQLDEVIEVHEKARDFWMERLEAANAP